MDNTSNLNRKIKLKVLKLLSRINFVAWSAIIIGFIVLGISFFLYYITESGQHTEVEGIGVLIGLLLITVGFWMTAQIKNTRKSNIDLQKIKKKIAILNTIALLVGIIIVVPILYFFPIWGLGLTVVYVTLLSDITKLYLLALNAKKFPEETITLKFILKKIRIIIYPKINHNKKWHRLVTVTGWIVSIFSYFILFPIFFGVIQRVIYFVIYGDQKEKWLVKE